MVHVKKLEIVMGGKVSKMDVMYAVVEAALLMWRGHRGVLHRAFNAHSMKRAGLGRIS